MASSIWVVTLCIEVKPLLAAPVIFIPPFSMIGVIVSLNSGDSYKLTSNPARDRSAAAVCPPFPPPNIAICLEVISFS